VLLGYDYSDFDLILAKDCDFKSIWLWASVKRSSVEPTTIDYALFYQIVKLCMFVIKAILGCKHDVSNKNRNLDVHNSSSDVIRLCVTVAYRCRPVPLTRFNLCN